MALAILDATAITDWDSFHTVSQQAFGFPDFYGRNLNAWHDCLTHLDDGMSRFDLAADETLTIEVRGAHDFAQRCPEIALALTEAVAFVNDRNLAVGAPARLLLLLA
jgi:hypothetical protein